MVDYRDRLLPFIARWAAEGARVAIFGIGPHTEFLFDKVPVLATVNLVGYLDSNLKLRDAEYRGRAVHPPDWADRNADVVLCSSFVSEPGMAASVEHLRCKILLSHASPEPASPQQSASTDYVFRPEPAAAMIDWPPACGAPQAPGAGSAAWGWESGVARYLGSTAVLDAILEQYFPFVRPEDRHIARVIVRYVRPGSHVIQIGGRSEGAGLLLASCCLPKGRFVSLMPSYRLGSFIPALQARCGLAHCVFALAPEAFGKQEYQSHPFVTCLPPGARAENASGFRGDGLAAREALSGYLSSATRPRSGCFPARRKPRMHERAHPRTAAFPREHDRRRIAPGASRPARRAGSRGAGSAGLLRLRLPHL